ncbi:transmembrane protein 207 isoform X3 [Pezoporus flaviventris]|uniref:transmembrane protein 207 isoform X3 n=1 Tax=Pezoporus flaviventris TaxID=889875 RepID=UPI002AB214BF|nr:transmembrane protein 207 isoform X3 [Pezoporus flaviventris]
MQRSFKSSKLQRVKHCCKQSSSHVSPASDAKTWSFVSHFMDHRNWSSVFKLLAADSASDCELGERCIRQSDENFSSWYVWFLMLFFLALLLSCGICCCLQCWLKRRSCLPHRRTQAVFALSSSDAFCGKTAPAYLSHQQHPGVCQKVVLVSTVHCGRHPQHCPRASRLLKTGLQ